MRTMFFIVQKEFLQIFRNKTMLPLILIMPVFQMLLLSFAANYEIKNLSLGVVDHDLSTASRQMTAKFSASGYFKLKQQDFSAKAAIEGLAADRTDLFIEIPANFERDLVREGKSSVYISANAINAVKAGLAIGYANGIIRDFVPPIPATAGAQLPKPLVNTEVSYWYNPKLDYKAFMVPGILGEIVSLIICFLTALNLVREREIGTIEQINVTPVKKWQFILGKFVPFWFLSTVIMSVGLSIGWLVFRIPIEGDLWLVLVYTLAFMPTMLGLGFLISNFAETQQQAMFTAWFFILIFILMCGLFTPADSMPMWAQWLNVLNPIKYFVDFMRMVLLKGAGLPEIKTNLLQVLSYGLVVNSLAVWTYRKRSG